MNQKDEFEILLQVASQPDTNEDAIYEALEAAGIPKEQADRLYKFTQIAWGRVLLDGLNITFTQQYFCLDADGSIIESGQLHKEPYYAYAMSWISQNPPHPAFEFMATTSSDVNTVNQALHAGSKLENLILSPPIIFLAVPTEEGLKKAKELMIKHVEAIDAQNKKKPWWKIW